MTRRQNIQHGQARPYPRSRAWPIAAGVLLGCVLAAVPLLLGGGA